MSKAAASDSADTDRRRGFVSWKIQAAAVLAFAIALAVVWIATTPSKPTAAISSTGKGPSRAEPGLAALAGRWFRADGGYVLELGAPGVDGRVPAKYLNPRPIHVERADARMEGGEVLLEVELRDTGYPGCIYTLKYDASTDRLAGQYFQAAKGETYQIVFERLR
jgi:hypothetical protein